MLALGGGRSTRWRRTAMLCAHTVRRLKAGTFDEFVERFAPPADAMAPAGWVRFHVLRSTSDPDQVVTFGFFDGTPDDLERSQNQHGYDDMRSSIDGLVEEVVANGVYEVVVTRSLDATAA
jgi:heme-degrading monooxygenase HmoA